MRAQKSADRLIESCYPKRMQPRPAGELPKVVIKSVNDLNGHRIVQSTDACRGGAAAEIPQQGLRHPRQLYGDRLHDGDRNSAACRLFRRHDEPSGSGLA